MKKILAIAFTVALLATGITAAVPVSAANYSNKEYWRYPIKADYEALGNPGYAKGMLTVLVDSWVNNSDGGCHVDAVAFWADEDGPLDGYSHLARFKLSTRSTTFTFPDLQIIPEGADRLRVYTAINGTDKLSDKYADAMLPENWDYIPAGDPVKRFVVVSDTHLRSNDSEYANKVFRDMLNDVNDSFSDVAGIFINGDNVNSSGMSGNGTDIPKAQLEKLKSYCEEICPDIPLFMAVGNHDLWPNADRESLKKIFTGVATLPDGSHPDSIHYDFWLDNCHFVIIGDDDSDPNYATLTDQTLKWLDQTLADGYSDETRTFIFFHQALSNTVAGSLTDFGQEWDGVVNAVEVRAVLRKYPDAILFSGHSHYTMDSVQNAFSGGSIFPTTFNTSSLSNVSCGDEDEAQGYIVEVYDDVVLVRGYDFANNEWKGTAQYAVSFSDSDSGNPPVFPESKPNDTEKTTEAPTDKTTDKPTDKTTAASTNESGSDATDAAKTSGCGATLSAGGAAATLFSAVACLFKKKKKKDK